MTAIERLRSLDGVRRAWPGRNGNLSFETVDELGRLRAGEITSEGWVVLADYALDAKLPELSPDLAGTLVVHRLHRRAVVLGEGRVSKLVRAGRAAGVVAATHRFAELAEGTAVTVAKVLEHSDSRVDFALLPGTTLHELGIGGLPGWQRFAESWPQLVARPGDLPWHTGFHEAEVLWQWYQWASAFETLPGIEQLRRLVERTCEELALEQGPLVPVHRDLHDKQLVWEGQSLGILDLDTVALGEAALDIGNLLAHVELRGVQGLWPAELGDHITSVLATVAGQLPTTTSRLAVYYRAALLRLAFVYSFRPATWLPAWVDHCHAHIGPHVTSRSFL